MPYTTQGFMTQEDLAEVRADLDLDLCGCCEDDAPAQGRHWVQIPDDPEYVCVDCEHQESDHVTGRPVHG